MARPVRKSRDKEVPLSEVKADLSRCLRGAEKAPVVITRHGKAAGVLIGFESDQAHGHEERRPARAAWDPAGDHRTEADRTYRYAGYLDRLRVGTELIAPGRRESR